MSVSGWVHVCLGMCMYLCVCLWGMYMSVCVCGGYVYVCICVSGCGYVDGVQLPQRPEASDPIGNGVTGSYEPLHDIMFEGSTQVLHSSTAYF